MDREQMIKIGAEGIRARLSPMFNQMDKDTENAAADSVLAALEAAGVVMVDRNLVADLIVSIEDQEVKKSFEAAWTAMLAARPK